MIYDDLRIRTLWCSVATWNHLERTSFCKLCGEEPPEYPQNVHKSSFCLDKTIHPSWSLVQDPSPAWVAENQRENSGNIRKSCGLVSKWKKLEYPKGCLLDKDRLDRGGLGVSNFELQGTSAAQVPIFRSQSDQRQETPRPRRHWNALNLPR